MCVCVCDVNCVMCEVCDICESVVRALLHTVDSFTPRPHAHVMIMITCGNDICGTATNTQSDIIP